VVLVNDRNGADEGDQDRANDPQTDPSHGSVGPHTAQTESAILSRAAMLLR
jgi:hypothetical protein